MENNEEMVVKSLSVPVGLEELMEGLTKEVLRTKPTNIYTFASEHFAGLLSLREKGNFKGTKIKHVKTVVKKIKEEKPPKATCKILPVVKQQPVRKQSPNRLYLTGSNKFVTRKEANKNKPKRNVNMVSPKPKENQERSTRQNKTPEGRMVNGRQNIANRKNISRSSSVEEQPKAGKLIATPPKLIRRAQTSPESFSSIPLQNGFRKNETETNRAELPDQAEVIPESENEIGGVEEDRMETIENAIKENVGGGGMKEVNNLVKRSIDKEGMEDCNGISEDGRSAEIKETGNLCGNETAKMDDTEEESKKQDGSNEEERLPNKKEEVFDISAKDEEVVTNESEKEEMKSTTDVMEETKITKGIKKEDKIEEDRMETIENAIKENVGGGGMKEVSNLVKRSVDKEGMEDSNGISEVGRSAEIKEIGNLGGNESVKMNGTEEESKKPDGSNEEERPPNKKEEVFDINAKHEEVVTNESEKEEMKSTSNVMEETKITKGIRKEDKLEANSIIHEDSEKEESERILEQDDLAQQQKEVVEDTSDPDKSHLVKVRIDKNENVATREDVKKEMEEDQSRNIETRLEEDKIEDSRTETLTKADNSKEFQEEEIKHVKIIINEETEENNMADGNEIELQLKAIDASIEDIEEKQKKELEILINKEDLEKEHCKTIRDENFDKESEKDLKSEVVDDKNSEDNRETEEVNKMNLSVEEKNVSNQVKLGTPLKLLGKESHNPVTKEEIASELDNEEKRIKEREKLFDNFIEEIEKQEVGREVSNSEVVSEPLGMKDENGEISRKPFLVEANRVIEENVIKDNEDINLKVMPKEEEELKNPDESKRGFNKGDEQFGSVEDRDFNLGTEKLDDEVTNGAKDEEKNINNSALMKGHIESVAQREQRPIENEEDTSVSEAKNIKQVRKEEEKAVDEDDGRTESLRNQIESLRNASETPTEDIKNEFDELAKAGKLECNSFINEERQFMTSEIENSVNFKDLDMSNNKSSKEDDANDQQVYDLQKLNCGSFLREERKFMTSELEETIKNAMESEVVDNNQLTKDEGNIKQTYDPEKLQNELKEIERERELNNYNNKFNPFILKKEIKNASLELEERAKDEENVSKMADIVSQINAATKIQAFWRGFQTRKEISKREADQTKETIKSEPEILQKKSSMENENNEEHISSANNMANVASEVAAARKIQAVWRGFRVRKRINKRKINEKVSKGHVPELSSSEEPLTMQEENLQILREKSAVKIQSVWRAFLARKLFKEKIKTKKSFTTNLIEYGKNLLGIKSRDTTETRTSGTRQNEDNSENKDITDSKKDDRHLAEQQNDEWKKTSNNFNVDKQNLNNKDLNLEKNHTKSFDISTEAIIPDDYPTEDSNKVPYEKNEMNSQERLGTIIENEEKNTEKLSDVDLGASKEILVNKETIKSAETNEVLNTQNLNNNQVTVDVDDVSKVKNDQNSFVSIFKDHPKLGIRIEDDVENKIGLEEAEDAVKVEEEDKVVKITKEEQTANEQRDECETAKNKLELIESQPHIEPVAKEIKKEAVPDKSHRDPLNIIKFVTEESLESNEEREMKNSGDSSNGEKEQNVEASERENKLYELTKNENEETKGESIKIGDEVKINESADLRSEDAFKEETEANATMGNKDKVIGTKEEEILLKSSEEDNADTKLSVKEVNSVHQGAFDEKKHYVSFEDDADNKTDDSKNNLTDLNDLVLSRLKSMAGTSETVKEESANPNIVKSTVLTIDDDNVDLKNVKLFKREDSDFKLNLETITEEERAKDEDANGRKKQESDNLGDTKVSDEKIIQMLEKLPVVEESPEHKEKHLVKRHTVEEIKFEKKIVTPLTKSLSSDGHTEVTNELGSAVEDTDKDKQEVANEKNNSDLTKLEKEVKEFINNLPETIEENKINFINNNLQINEKNKEIDINKLYDSKYSADKGITSPSTFDISKLRAEIEEASKEIKKEDFVATKANELQTDSFFGKQSQVEDGVKDEVSNEKKSNANNEEQVNDYEDILEMKEKEVGNGSRDEESNEEGQVKKYQPKVDDDLQNVGQERPQSKDSSKNEEETKSTSDSSDSLYDSAPTRPLTSDTNITEVENRDKHVKNSLESPKSISRLDSSTSNESVITVIQVQDKNAGGPEEEVSENDLGSENTEEGSQKLDSMDFIKNEGEVSDEMAAVKIQKNYRSYRVRRDLKKEATKVDKNDEIVGVKSMEDKIETEFVIEKQSSVEASKSQRKDLETISGRTEDAQQENDSLNDKPTTDGRERSLANKSVNDLMETGGSVVFDSQNVEPASLNGREELKEVHYKKAVETDQGRSEQDVKKLVEYTRTKGKMASKVSELSDGMGLEHHEKQVSPETGEERILTVKGNKIGLDGEVVVEQDKGGRSLTNSLEETLDEEEDEEEHQVNSAESVSAVRGILPKGSSEVVRDKSEEFKENGGHFSGDSSTTGLVQTEEIFDNSLPVEVQTDQPPGAEILTSRLSNKLSSVKIESISTHASNKDAFSAEFRTPPTPDKKHLASSRSMEEKRINASIKKNSMEAEAATKIQASFRGYQVRKQLKSKNGSSDILINNRRSLRRKNSNRKSETARNVQNNKSKSISSDLEERSATKIQAGIRGFLVRKRQKNLKKTRPESA